MFNRALTSLFGSRNERVLRQMSKSVNRINALEPEFEKLSDDALRGKMQVSENPRFTKDYYDADKRYIGNAVQVFFKDGSSTDKVSIDYPIGHRKRRAEGIPVLLKKFEHALRGQLPAHRVQAILAACAEPAQFDAMPVNDLMGLFSI